ncbi:MAG: hypothetical protein R2709_11935 [Marmoricola sp.]
MCWHIIEILARFAAVAGVVSRRPTQWSFGSILDRGVETIAAAALHRATVQGEVWAGRSGGRCRDGC